MLSPSRYRYCSGSRTTSTDPRSQPTGIWLLKHREPLRQRGLRITLDLLFLSKDIVAKKPECEDWKGGPGLLVYP